MSDSSHSLSSCEIDELHEKITALETALAEEKARVNFQIEGLQESTDIGITERAQCFQDIDHLHKGLTTARLDFVDHLEGQIIQTRFMYRSITGGLIVGGAHCIWCLATIIKKIYEKRS